MFGLLKTLLVVGVKVYGHIRGTEKITFADTLPFAVGQLLPAVQQAVQYQGLNTKEKFDAWLTTVDSATGEDPGAVDLIGGLPRAKEEILFDHLIEAARIYGYHLIGIEGYK